MKFDILTLFPQMFSGPFSESILKKAVENGLIDIRIHNVRDYAAGKHKVTDDSPYGGGAGMVMKVEPIAACLRTVRKERPAAKVVLATPRGRRLDQSIVRELAKEQELIIICGRYEGVDERVSELFVDLEISVGDFILTGGELPAMIMVDAVSRLVPGVLGSSESAEADSFEDGLLEYPHYTRPPEFEGLKVPDVLLSGNHEHIRRWRRCEALKKTISVRPDLLDRAALGDEDIKCLREFGKRD